MTGSIRRVTTKPSVTAGLKCPEMRMSAVTKTDSTSPCASATISSPPFPELPAAIMIAIPPTNTRANVPMNSAAKWRTLSFMSCVLGGVRVSSRAKLDGGEDGGKQRERA